MAKILLFCFLIVSLTFAQSGYIGYIKYTNGNKYEGYIVNDKPHGKGKKTYANGNIFEYEGDFVDGECTGKGKITYAIGAIYEGDVVKGQKHGKGKFTIASFFQYEGDFVNEEFHGKGKGTYANGNIYEGDFANGYRTGKGKMTYADGKVEEGNWKYNKFLGSAPAVSETERALGTLANIANTLSAPASGNSLTDSRNGQKYRTVKIGSQTWMAENLNYNTSGSKCYDNKESNCQKYGRLYDWKTAKSACPSGWHLPSKAEWDALSNSVGGEKTTGKHLKAKSGWNNDNKGKSGNGIDTYGFAAIPGGDGSSGGDFDNVGNYGSWWSASEYSSSLAYYRFMSYSLESADWYKSGKNFMFSVRCVQD